MTLNNGANQFGILVYRSIDHFKLFLTCCSSFQVVMGHFRSFLARSRLFQVVSRFIKYVEP